MLLDILKAKVTEMIGLAQRIENYDATVAASQTLGMPIEPRAAVHAERRRAVNGSQSCGSSGACKGAEKDGRQKRLQDNA